MSIFSHNHRFYPIHISTNVILTTFLAVFAAVSTMISNVAIQGELALSHTESIWLTTINLLGVNTIVPTGNWFANRFGYNRIYTFGIVIFTLASLTAGLAPNFYVIATARFLEGAGAGFIFPVGLSLIVKSLPPKKVALGINLYIGLAFGLGLGLGIFLAGYFTQWHSWRSIFFSIVPFGILATISCWMSRKSVPPQSTQPFDFFGFITFASAICCLLVALTLGPIRSTDEGWHSWYIITLFITSILSLIICLIIESKHPSPLIPLTLFKDPVFSVSLAAMFLLGMGIFASISVSIDYMLNGLHYEKYTIGKIAAVYGLTFGLCSVISSYLVRIIPTPIMTFSGLAIMIGSYFLNNELSWLTGYSQVIPILLLRGMGIGLALGPTTTMALSYIRDELKPSAATILTFFRQVGGTYGGTLIAIFSIRRKIFHAQRFSEQVNTQLPAYQQTIRNLKGHSLDPKLAKLEIIKNIETQSFIQGLNDALIIFGYITLFFAIILFLLIGYRALKEKISPTNSSL